MAKKDDFILMTRSSGGEVLININKIKFIMPFENDLSKFYFGPEDYLIIKCTVDEFPELV